MEEEYVGTGRCSGLAWLDTVREWGLPVDDEAMLHLPDRKPREARGRGGKQTVMSSLTQKGVSPPGRRLQRHHTQKHSFRSRDVCRHLQAQFTISCTVSRKRAHPTEAHISSTSITLVNRHPQGRYQDDPSTLEGHRSKCLHLECFSGVGAGAGEEDENLCWTLELPCFLGGPPPEAEEERTDTKR